MHKIINFFSKKPLQETLVCNYENNYYGDQICVKQLNQSKR